MAAARWRTLQAAVGVVMAMTVVTAGTRPVSATHSGAGNHHWLVVADGGPGTHTDPSGGSPGGPFGTGDATFDNTSLIPTGAKVTSNLDMRSAKDSNGGNWLLKWSGSGTPVGNFCGENSIGPDTTVASLVPLGDPNSNGGAPWGVNVVWSPTVAKGFLWEIVWPSGGQPGGPPTAPGSYETCVVGSSDFVLQTDTIIYFDVVA